MKKILLSSAVFFLAAICSIDNLVAQIQPRFTQYMYTQVLFNPAYTGVQDDISGILLSRNQWTGIDGAPMTQGGNVSKVLKKSNAFGLSFTNDKIGVAKTTNISVSFAHKVWFSDDSYLSLGLQSSFSSFSENLSNVNTSTEADPVFISTVNHATNPNFGFGSYYSRHNFYAGLSVPYLLHKPIVGSTVGSLQFEPRQLHYYMVSGAIMDLNEKTIFSPSVFMKHVSGAPVQFNATALFLYKESILGLVSYNSERAVSAGVGYMFKRFKIVYTYDLTLSKLRPGAGSTHEISVLCGFPFYTSPLTKFMKRKYLNKNGTFKKQ